MSDLRTNIIPPRNDTVAAQRRRSYRNCSTRIMLSLQSLHHYLHYQALSLNLMFPHGPETCSLQARRLSNRTRHIYRQHLDDHLPSTWTGLVQPMSKREHEIRQQWSWASGIHQLMITSRFQTRRVISYIYHRAWYTLVVPPKMVALGENRGDDRYPEETVASAGIPCQICRAAETRTQRQVTLRKRPGQHSWRNIGYHRCWSIVVAKRYSEARKMILPRLKPFKSGPRGWIMPFEYR